MKQKELKPPPTRKVTDGGRDLREYLTLKKISVPTFCEQQGLNRIQIQRVLNGERYQRISVDLAFAIEDATRGGVKARRFLSRTAQLPKAKVRTVRAKAA